MDWTREQVLDEIARIKYLYKMKGVIRYDRTRDKFKRAESVAEHIFGMQILSDYFLILENPDASWNREKIHGLILAHDLSEIETGDIVGYRKTKQDRENEHQAIETMLTRTPQLIRDKYQELIQEYEAQQTIESQFVKAIDKIEASIELFDDVGKDLVLGMKSTRDEHVRIKDPYTRKFPAIDMFSQTITEEMVERGYFPNDNNNG